MRKRTPAALLTSLLLIAAASCSNPHLNWGPPLVQGVWSNLPPMSTARAGAATVVASGRLYVIGGDIQHTSVEFWNGTTWTAGPSLPQPLQFMGGATQIGGKIYLIACCNSGPGLTDVMVLDPAGGGWTSLPAVPNQIQNYAVGAVNNKLYAVGGFLSTQCGGGNCPPPVLSNILYEFDPLNPTWKTKKSMPTARGGPHAAAINGRLFVIGGLPSTGKESFNQVESYDPATDTWLAHAPLPLGGSMGVTVFGPRIFAIGGETENNSAINRAFVFDPAGDTWKPVPSLPRGGKVVNPSAFGPQVIVAGNGSDILSGGNNDTGTQTTDVQGFTLGTAALPAPRRVFVTQATFTPNVDLTSLANADTNCGSVALAATPSLGSGNWKAWLSDDSTSALSRIADVGPWVFVNGSAAYASKAAIAFGTPITIRFNENGAPVGAPSIAWTGTYTDGTIFNNGTCINWTSPGAVGEVGSTTNAVTWTADSTISCTSSAHLYCFEQ